MKTTFSSIAMTTLLILNGFSQNLSWTPISDFGGTARYGAISFTIGAKGYAGAGSYNAQTTNFNDFWEYDPATDLWTQKASFGGAPRTELIFFSIGAKGYAGSGWNGTTYFSDFWEYDPSTNTWLQKANFPTPARYAAVGFSIGNKGYAGTGYDGFTLLNDFYEYDPATDVWTQKANYGGSIRYACVGFSIGNTGYIGTGWNGSSYDNVFWAYDPASDTWSQIANLGGVGRDGAVAFVINTKGYVGLGWTSSTLLGDFWEYDPQLSSWTQVTTFPGTQRDFALAFAIGNNGYVGTGYDGSIYNTNMWRLYPCIPAVNSTNVSCFGANDGDASATLNGGVPPYTYTWSNGQTNSSVSGLSAGTYFVTIADSSGCISADSVIITQPTAVSISMAQSNIFCNGNSDGSATATVSGGTAPYTYLWNNPLPAQSTSACTGLIAGTWTVTATDNNGCAATTTVTLIEPTPVTASSTLGNVSCNGACDGTASVTATGGTPPYLYNWNNGSVISYISGLCPGSFAVTITDANGCTFVNTGTIAQPVPLISSVTDYDLTTCGSMNGLIDITITGGTPPYNYNWSNGEVTEDITGLQAGLYFVQVTDANGCTTGQSATLTEPPAISLSFTKTDVSACTGSDGAIDITVGGGIVPYTFIWSNGTSGEDISNVPAGGYGVTVIDSIGCHANLSVTLTQPSSFTLNITTFNTTCAYDCNGLLSVTASGGNSPFTYYWNDVTAQTGQIATGLCTGLYEVIVTDANGCISSGTGTVSGPPALSIAIAVNNSTSCGGSDGSVTATLSGGTPPYQYSWSNGSTELTATGLAGGIHYLTALDATNCVIYGTVTISDLGGPSITVNSVTDLMCSNNPSGVIDISVTGGATPYTYLWSTGAMTEDLANAEAGDYQVEVYDASGCAASQSITVNSPPSFNVNVTTQNSSCGSSDGMAMVTTTGGVPPYDYLWSVFSDSNVVAGLLAGLYDVTVTDANMCLEVRKAVVGNNGAPLIHLDSMISIGCGDSLTGAIYVNVSGGILPYIYLWSNGSTTEDQVNLSAGIYNLIVNDSIGCISVLSETITQDPPITDPICMVTVDTATGENLIVWEKSGLHIAYYNIYREIGQSGNFFFIGTVLSADESVFLDTISNPHAKSYRYKLGVVDSCGNESEFYAPVHKTMHLNASQSGNAITLHWDPYSGFNYFDQVIFRGTSMYNMISIDTIPANQNSYTDNNPPSGVMLYYNVAALHPYGCTTTAQKIKTYNFSKSNTASVQAPTGGLAKEEMIGGQVFIFPNPFSESATIFLNIQSPGNKMKLVVNDVFGRTIRAANIPIGAVSYIIPRGNLSDGVYFYKIVADYGILAKGKLVIY